MSRAKSLTLGLAALGAVLVVTIAATMPSHITGAAVVEWTCAENESIEDGMEHYDGVNPGFLVTSPDFEHIEGGVGGCFTYPQTGQGHTNAIPN